MTPIYRPKTSETEKVKKNQENEKTAKNHVVGQGWIQC